jgi:hypothetical protein
LSYLLKGIAMNENTYRTAKTVLITISITLASVFAFGYLDRQNAKDSEFFCDGTPVKIESGDTLYWIARTKCEGNTMEVVDRLVELYGTTLTIGDTIYLPTHNACELRITDGGEVMEECA